MSAKQRSVHRSKNLLLNSQTLRQRDRMVVRFMITYAISAYHHQSCEFELRSWRDVLDTTLCNKVCR
jgi:hypothetical protein